MISNLTVLPALSPSQREPVAGSVNCMWRGVQTGCESSCSTVAASDVAASESSESDTEKEVAREFGPADVDWLLTALTKEQKAHLDRSLFRRECERIFRIMDKDESGFLDQCELEEVIAHLIPEPHRGIDIADGQRLMVSIQSVLTSFDKDSDRQLSSEEFPDFVRFCYAWRSHQEQVPQTASDIARPPSRGRLGNSSLPPCGPAHRLVRSASMGRIPSGLSRAPPDSPRGFSKAMARSASNPAIRPGTSQGSSKRKAFQSGASSRRTSPEPMPFSGSSSKTASRSSSVSGTQSINSSRRPSKSVPSHSNASSRIPSPEPASGSKHARKEDLEKRQMKALKALLKELVASHRKLPDLIAALMHNTMSADGSQAFPKDILEHVTDVVMQASKERFSPRSYGPVTTTAELTPFLQELGHIPLDPDSEADEAALSVDRAVEVVALLSVRWFALRQHMSVPEMSEYQKQRWLPPAFSYLVGQILWRHRAADCLQSSAHTSVLENLRWITAVPGAMDDMIDQVNIVFQMLSDSGRMRLCQWPKVVQLIASNPELRTRVRRCDAIRACYGDALGHSSTGLSRKNFKLMLVKTADLMGVHPVVLFQELASHAEELQKAQKKDAPLFKPA